MTEGDMPTPSMAEVDQNTGAARVTATSPSTTSPSPTPTSEEEPSSSKAPSASTSNTTTTTTISDSPSSFSTSPHLSSSQPQQCANCLSTPSPASPTSSLKPCTKCHTTLYCSKTCLKSDTKNHKKLCAGLAQVYAQTAEYKPATGRQPPREGYQKGLRKWQFDT